MRDYTKIEAWPLADDLTVAVYERTRSFPREEIYGLTAQLRRASYSVLADIVEGASRESKRDYLHFSTSRVGHCRRRSILYTFTIDSVIYRRRKPTYCGSKRSAPSVAFTAHPSREEEDRKTDGGKAKFTVIS